MDDEDTNVTPKIGNVPCRNGSDDGPEDEPEEEPTDDIANSDDMKMKNLTRSYCERTANIKSKEKGAFDIDVAGNCELYFNALHDVVMWMCSSKIGM